MTESMSVLTDPATFGILSSELTKCPRTAAALGELAAQWQQMMGFLQRVEQDTVSSQSVANAVENMNKTRIDATARRLRLKDGERLYPKSWSGSTPIGGFEREVAAWLGRVDPKHEAGKVIQRITKGTLRATEARTDGRYAEDDKPGSSPGQRDRRRSKSHGPEDQQIGAKSRVRGMASIGRRQCTHVVERPSDSAAVCTCDDKDAKELKERLTAWSLKVAEYQFKTIEAQKIRCGGK